MTKNKQKVKTQRSLILATCFLSGVGAVISFVSLGTQEWVNGEDNQKPDPDTIKFGLFDGTLTMKTILEATIPLTMTCVMDLNACAPLCGYDQENNLRKMYNKEDLPESIWSNCSEKTVKTLKMLRASDDNDDIEFINAGIWLCTILFLILSGAVGLVCAALSIWNTVSSPYQDLFNTFGLYIYNSVALCFSLLAIILWGAMYNKILIENIPTYLTYNTEVSTKDLATLGYSYWINLISCFCYIGSICLLYLRQYLISKEPKTNVQIEDNADPVILLY